MHFCLSGNNNSASLEQQWNLKGWWGGSQCLKGILETVLALGRKTCLSGLEVSQPCE